MTLSLPISLALRERDVTGDADAPADDGQTTLADLATGQTGTVLGVCDAARPDVARRLFDLGFMPGTAVTRVRQAPFGGPVVVRVADYELTLRHDQAHCVVLGTAVAGGHGCGLADVAGCDGCPA